MNEELGWLVRELHSLASELRDSEAPLILAIDQGGHASRAIVFDAHGTLCAESFAPISTFRSGDDRVEHDANEILESIRTALDDVAQTLGSDAERVVAAGLATQRSSVVCWDKRTGTPLSRVLSWQDRRNAALVEQLRGEASAVCEHTGLVLSPHYGASKLRWCLDEIPAVRTARDGKRLAFGPLASFLLFSLLEGRPYLVDPANASRTQLFEPRTRAWSPWLAERFGVPLELLPRIAHTRAEFGRLQFAGRDIPLRVCTGDQSAVPYAFGSLDPATIYLNAGTGAFLQRVREHDDPQLLQSVVYSDEQRVVTIQEGTVNGAGAAIDWLNEHLGVDARRGALALTRATANHAAPLFLNAVGGIGSPYWRSDVSSRFVGEGSEAAQVQAAVESIAFLICRNIERMQDAAVARILASGGLSASDYLCECIATLSGLPVERVNVRESTALGLAFLVAGEPADWQPHAERATFAPAVDEALRERYARWCELMETL